VTRDAGAAAPALRLALLIGPGVDAGYAPGLAGAAAVAVLGMVAAQRSRRSKQREVATPAYAPKHGIAR
jgi:hypothetical protein